MCRLGILVVSVAALPLSFWGTPPSSFRASGYRVIRMRVATAQTGLGTSLTSRCSHKRKQTQVGNLSLCYVQLESSRFRSLSSYRA